MFNYKKQVNFLSMWSMIQANIRNPRAVGDKLNKAVKDLGKGIKNLFKKSK